MFPLDEEHVPVPYLTKAIGFHLFEVECRFDVLDMRPSSK
jgi:hypothetical protein